LTCEHHQADGDDDESRRHLRCLFRIHVSSPPKSAGD
jgi:hypothetical protein